jgi:hypothetical protein
MDTIVGRLALETLADKALVATAAVTGVAPKKKDE